MKTNRLTGVLLSAFAALALQQAAAQPLNLHTLTNDTYLQNFDSLLVTNNPWTPGNLPAEWTCYLNATPTFYGTIAPFTNNVDAWDYAFTGDFKDFAGFFDYIGGTNFVGTEDWGYQTNEPNRCLGIRQTGSFGDPGAAFVLKLTDTTNLHNFVISADFLNLDATSPRQTVWTVDYGFADPTFGVPFSFFPVAQYTNVPGTFNSYHTNIALADGTINNIDTAVWIRIVALTPSDGSGNRESFAIDNVGLTWTNGTGGCTRVRVAGSPKSTTVYSNATATFTVTPAGTGPYGFQWFKGGSPLSDVGNIVGSTASQLLVKNCTTSDQGSYTCTVSNFCTSANFDTSQGATLTITNAPTATIGYLLTLVDPKTFAITNGNAYWQITGLVTTATNITSGNTASYYIQDGTGGINLFVTGGRDNYPGGPFRPQPGDVVTAIGFLSSFQGHTEFFTDYTGSIGSRNASMAVILSNNIAAYPAPKIPLWDGRLGVAPTNTDLNLNYAGSVALLTNVYFGTNAGVVIPTPGANRFFNVTNANGQLCQVVLEAQQVYDLTNRPLPAFAYSVQGIFLPFTTTTTGAVPTNGNYEIIVTKWSDIVTNPLSLTIAYSTSPTITWTAVPLTYTYSVWSAHDVTGPYSTVATGLKFSDSNGTYTDPSPSPDRTFYRVTIP